MTPTILMLIALSTARWPELPPEWPSPTVYESAPVDIPGVYPAPSTLRAPIPDSLYLLPDFVREAERPPSPNIQATGST